MFCPKCGKEIESNQNYCYSCGTNLNRTPSKQQERMITSKQSLQFKQCLNCGTYNPESQIICSNCGKNVNNREVYSQNDSNSNGWIFGCCCLLIIIIVIIALI